MKRTFITCLFLILPAFSTTAFAVTNEKELFVVAQRAFEDGFYDVSLKYLDQLTQEFPSSAKLVEAKLLQGQCYFFKKQYVKAFAVFKEIAAQPAYKDATLFWLGETYLKGGDIPKAQEQYRLVIDSFPNSLYTSQAYYSLGWSYFQKGDYLTAKKTFQQLVDKYPSNNLAEDASFKISECDYNASNYEGAIFNFNKYIQDHPRSNRLYEANFNIAEAYYYLDQFDKAVDAYQKARALARQPAATVAALVGAGWSYAKLRKYDESIKTFSEARNAAREASLPEDDVLLGLASLYTLQEKFKDAAGIYTEIINKYPNSTRQPETYLGRANAYYLANDFAAAVSDYKFILNTYSSRAAMSDLIEKSRFGLAWTYLKSGDLLQAVATFQSIVERASSPSVKVSALTQIADAYQDAGQYEKSIEYYDRILKDMPDTPYNDHVKYRQSLAMLKAGRLDQASLALQALIAEHPKSKYAVDAGYYLGVIYYKKHDWSSAKDVLGSFIRSAPANSDFIPESKHILALSYLNLKQYDKATALFNEIIKQYPSHLPLIQSASLGLAKTYYEMKDVKESLARFKDIVNRYPRTPASWESLLWLAQQSMDFRAYERAVDYYLQALTDFPSNEKNTLVHYELARAYQAAEKFDKALEHYRQVDKVSDPLLYAKARLAIAELFTREMDPEKAVETYRNIIATSPDFKRDALIKIAQIYRKQHQFKEELEAYQQAFAASRAQSETTNAQIQFAMGDCLEMMGQLQKAVEIYFKIPYLYAKEQGWVIRAFLRIGKIYENMEEWDKATTAYKKVVDMNVEESKFANERISWMMSRRSQ